jgi:pyruvate dehydrogenase phosphatase
MFISAAGGVLIAKQHAKKNQCEASDQIAMKTCGCGESHPTGYDVMVRDKVRGRGCTRQQNSNAPCEDTMSVH